MTPLYSAEGPPAARPSVLSGLTPDIHRNPREALRDMRLRGRARDIVMARLTGGASLQDDQIANPYSDSPDEPGSDYSRVRRSEGNVVVLQIPDWIANDGGLVGTLDENRYVFRGQVVRIVSEGVDAPSWGLKRLIKNWQAQEKIDTAFVEWRYVDEMGAGKHKIEEVLQFPAVAAAPTAAGRAGKKLTSRTEVFVSYSHLDLEWHEKTMRSLAPLMTEYPDVIWNDVRLEPGSDWFKEIRDKLAAARIVLLLVSPAFLASPFILKNELAPTLKAVEAKEKTLLWVYVKPCKYVDAGIGKYQAAHDNSKSLQELTEADQLKQLLCVYDALSAALAKLPASV